MDRIHLGQVPRNSRDEVSYLAIRAVPVKVLVMTMIHFSIPTLKAALTGKPVWKSGFPSGRHYYECLQKGAEANG